MEESSLERFNRLLTLLRTLKRPSIASVTNVMDIQSGDLWVRCWIIGSEVSDSDFAKLRNPAVIRCLNGNVEFAENPSRLEWQNLTSLNVKPGAEHYRHHERISLKPGPEFWPKDYVASLSGKPNVSISINCSGLKLTPALLKKIRHLLNRVSQHAIIIV